MATKHTTSSGGKQNTQRSNGDSARWIAGLLLFFIGLYATASVLFYFISWSSDQSVLQGVGADDPRFDGAVENLCGRAGARLGELFVGRGFGVPGILLPVMLMLIGVRIIRRKALLFNHSILSLFLIMILASLTLGFAFGDKWSLCSSSGWGGALGIEVARMLGGRIGAFGMLILLAGGWILTGVFINRNFINTVNSAGNAMVDRGGRIVEIVKHKVVAHHAQDEAFDDPEPEAPRPRREPDPVPDAAPAREAETPAAREEAIPAADGGDEAPAAAAGEVEIERPAPAPEAAETPEPEEAPAVAEKPAGEEDPFLELTTDEAAAPAVPSAATSAPGRVVMGDDGLIELDLSDAVVLPDPVPAAAAARPQAAPKPSEPEDGLMEVTLLGDEERIAPAQQMNAAEYPFHGSEAAPAAAEPADDETPAPEEEGIVVTVEEHDAPMMSEASIPTEAYDPLKDLVNYRKPPVTLLEDYRSDSEVSDEEIYENKSRIEETLKYFGIPIQRIKATVGPTVTLYEIVQAQGVKISKIQGLENDIAQSLKALGIRIIAPIPGKGTIGIEVPNRDKQVVSMYSAVRSMRFQESKAELPVVIGRTIQNENYVFDLAKMPHLLVAGATGQGKSVGLNAIITSLLYTKHPAQLKFVMIDPKMVEFSLYAKIEKHFLAKMESEEEAVITDPKKAVYTLNSLCVEMDNRLELCKKAGARNIAEYNDKFVARRLNPQHGHHYLPYIVVVVDEFADLIMTAREVEAPVMRLAQKARAIGIHLIIATQRPDVKVITGGIKANFPARIAFRVMQMIDSRTIIDQPGANQLIGRGDMLFSKDGELVRIQCALVETKEVERVVEHISKQQSYTAAYSLPDYTPETGSEPQAGGEGGAPVKFDALFAEIARTAVSGGSISTSMIQRNYEVGFNRAGRIMLQLERAGIVGRQEGAKPRDILYHDLPSLEAKLQELGLF